ILVVYFIYYDVISNIFIIIFLAHNLFIQLISFLIVYKESLTPREILLALLIKNPPTFLLPVVNLLKLWDIFCTMNIGFFHFDSNPSLCFCSLFLFNHIYYLIRDI